MSIKLRLYTLNRAMIRAGVNARGLALKVARDRAWRVKTFPVNPMHTVNVKIIHASEIGN